MSDINPDVVTQYERETSSRCATSYLDTFARLTGETVPLLLEAACIQTGSVVLEVGSGPGHVAGALARAGATVTGIDFSGEMVEVARQQFPRVRFQEANAEQLPFDDSSFDAVVSNFVVHHLARPDVVFKEGCRVLKSGGRFAFVVWGAVEEQASFGAFFAAVEAHHTLDELPHGPLFGVTDRSVYEALLAGSGLEGFHLDTHDIVWRSDSLDPILRGLWDWGNLAALPRDVQDKIEATTRENARPYEDGAGFSFPHTVLVGRAAKS